MPSGASAQLMAERQQAGELTKVGGQGGNQYKRKSAVGPKNPTAKTLADEGIDKSLAKRARTMGAFMTLDIGFSIGDMKEA
jgi:hypothetical protein